MTFNNRIGLRSLLKPAVYEGGKIHIRQQTDVAIKVDTSQTTFDRDSEPSTQLESYELRVSRTPMCLILSFMSTQRQALKENKIQDLAVAI